MHDFVACANGQCYLLVVLTLDESEFEEKGGAAAVRNAADGQVFEGLTVQDLASAERVGYSPPDSAAGAPVTPVSPPSVWKLPKCMKP